MFDARVYPAGLTDPDLQTLRFFGITRVLAAAVSPEPPVAVADIVAAQSELLSVQLPRLEREGLEGWAAVGIPARALPRRGLAELIDALPRLLQHPRARAVGPLELFKGGEAEEEAFTEQLKLARRLRRPVWVSARASTTRRVLQLLKTSGVEPARVLVDGAVTTTVKLIRECGHVAGLTVHPDGLTAEQAAALVRKLGAEGLVLSTGAGFGAADLLGLSRTAHLLQEGGLSRGVIARVTMDNAAALLEASV